MQQAKTPQNNKKWHHRVRSIILYPTITNAALAEKPKLRKRWTREAGAAQIESRFPFLCSFTRVYKVVTESGNLRRPSLLFPFLKEERSREELLGRRGWDGETSNGTEVPLVKMIPKSGTSSGTWRHLSLRMGFLLLM